MGRVMTVDEILATGRVCAVEECGKPHSARGWCATHYSRWKRTGQVESVFSNMGKPVEQRFWEKVNKAGPVKDFRLGNCWEWTGAGDSHGYGCFYTHGSKAKAHRFSYELEHGEIQQGSLIDHACHNPACVRPSHLQLSNKSLNGINRSGTESSTGFRGVYLRESGRYQARFKDRSGKKVTVGMFDNPNEASLAVREARIAEWGEHAGADR